MLQQWRLGLKREREGCKWIQEQQVTKAVSSRNSAQPREELRGAFNSSFIWAFSLVASAAEKKRQGGHGSCWGHRHAVEREKENCGRSHGEGF